MEYFETFLKGLNNFALYISGHISEITVVCAVGYLVYVKVKSFLEKSSAEKIAIAKAHVKEFMLSYVSKAEKDYADWIKAGETKRAQVIGQIFADYPILNTIADQDGLIVWIDEVIKDALKKMREMVSEINV